MSKPCAVERTNRSVIEKKLLAALTDESVVVIIATKKDLECMIAALYGYEISVTKGNKISWEAHVQRRKELDRDMEQLLKEAFQ